MNDNSQGLIEGEIIKAISAIEPQHLLLENESAHHAGYYPGKESHFKLVVVSALFEGKARVARHQMLYRLINHLLLPQGGQIHALAIHAFTPQQWVAQLNVPNSPDCAGKNVH